MVYQHLRVAEKLDAISNTTYLSLIAGGKALGACCLIPRKFTSASKSFEAYYIRYFSFRQSLRASSNSQQRLTHKKSSLRTEIKATLAGDGLEIKDPLCFAYVDESNIRSKAIIDSFGFRKVGSFHTIFFSRMAPRMDRNVSRLDPESLSGFKVKIAEYYGDHSFVCLDNIGFEGGTLIYKKDGVILAGLQAHKEHWRVDELPSNKHLITIISKIPFLNLIFQRDFKFLSIEGFFCEPGYEHTLEPLIESALVLNGRNTAIACADPKSPYYDQLSAIDGGMIRYFTKEKEIALVARGREELLDEISEKPIYVSGFDNM